MARTRVRSGGVARREWGNTNITHTLASYTYRDREHHPFTACARALHGALIALDEMSRMLVLLCHLASTAALRTPPPLPRRTALCGLGALAALGIPTPQQAYAASTTATAVVTDKVALEFVSLSGMDGAQQSLPMTIGLFGNDAPQAVRTFKAACAGKLDAPCPSDVDTSQELMERSKQSKKAAYKSCLGSAGEPVSYAYSQVWSIQGGKRINAGAVQGKFALREAPKTAVTESAGLSHDAPGLLSVKRGGGVFDFAITTAPTPEFDAEYAIIGRVLEGMESVAAIDAMPVVKAADAFGIADPSASRSMSCEYSNPQPFCAQGKPLRKVTLRQTAVL